MGRKSNEALVSEGIAAAVKDSNFYRNLAMRLATGRWYDIDIGNGTTLEVDINALIQPDDDYILVGPVLHSAIRGFKGYMECDVSDLLKSNVYGWLDNGVEVRVYSLLQLGSTIVGKTPVQQPDHRVKKMKMPIEIPVAEIQGTDGNCGNWGGLPGTPGPIGIPAEVTGDTGTVGTVDFSG